MIQKLFVLVVTVMAVHGASTAPRHQQLNKKTTSITDEINAKLEEIFSHINETLLPKNPIEIKLKQANVMDVYIKMETCSITGVKSFAAYDSFVTPYLNQTFDISISLKSPKVTLNSKHYTINGTMVDHVELFGNGPGMVSVDDMDIKVEGHGKVNLLPLFSVVFDTAILDLEMWRWTVNLEDLMPGTDLGTVFNEFFTMYGPEIFDIVENNINKSGKLLEFLNNILS